MFLRSEARHELHLSLREERRLTPPFWSGPSMSILISSPKNCGDWRRRGALWSTLARAHRHRRLPPLESSRSEESRESGSSPQWLGNRGIIISWVLSSSYPDIARNSSNEPLRKLSRELEPRKCISLPLIHRVCPRPPVFSRAFEHWTVWQIELISSPVERLFPRSTRRAPVMAESSREHYERTREEEDLPVSAILIHPPPQIEPRPKSLLPTAHPLMKTSTLCHLLCFIGGSCRFNRWTTKKEHSMNNTPADALTPAIMSIPARRGGKPPLNESMNHWVLPARTRSNAPPETTFLWIF